ncbi:hypothetical protein ACFL2H_05230 [Planctomycetota bacterium]
MTRRDKRQVVTHFGDIVVEGQWRWKNAASRQIDQGVARNPYDPIVNQGKAVVIFSNRMQIYVRCVPFIPKLTSGIKESGRILVITAVPSVIIVKVMNEGTVACDVCAKIKLRRVVSKFKDVANRKKSAFFKRCGKSAYCGFA